MIARATLSRRTLLLLGCTGFAVSCGVAVRWWARRDYEEVAGQLTGLLSQRAAAVDIGNEYLRLFPHERDVNELVVAIFDGAPPRTSSPQLRNAVDRRVRDDFVAGRTVRIRGWLLSRTEARVSALVALR